MKEKTRKLNIRILAAATAVVGILIPAAMLSSCADTSAEPPVSSAESAESETSSTEPIKVTVPEIKPPAPTDKKESSEPVSDLTVDGDPEADVSSEEPSEPASAPESKAASQAAGKPASSAVEEWDGQNEGWNADGTRGDPNNPKEGDIKIENGYWWAYSNGQWWEGESVDAQTVLDDGIPTICPLCGLSEDCTCVVGY